MIKTPTVLILGAGASEHLGYPLGRTLIKQICGAPTRSTILPVEKFSEADVTRFISRLSRSDPNSIDAFLEQNPEEIELGKYLITQQLKLCENEGQLFPPNDAGWYRTIFDTMFSEKVPSLTGNALKIITFNYDRSLEAYFYIRLKNQFNMEDAAATALLKEIPILHMHGILGEYPQNPYKKTTTPEELWEISQQIKIIHEMGSGEESQKFCSEDFKKANSYLQAAERIYFLGFGFHEENIKRFNFFNAVNLKNKKVIAAVHGIGNATEDKLTKKLSMYGFDRIKLEPWRCNQLFNSVIDAELD